MQMFGSAPIQLRLAQANAVFSSEVVDVHAHRLATVVTATGLSVERDSTPARNTIGHSESPFRLETARPTGQTREPPDKIEAGEMPAPKRRWATELCLIVCIVGNCGPTSKVTGADKMRAMTSAAGRRPVDREVRRLHAMRV